mgnify:CR=1 FL=1
MAQDGWGRRGQRGGRSPRAGVTEVARPGLCGRRWGPACTVISHLPSLGYSSQQPYGWGQCQRLSEQGTEAESKEEPEEPADPCTEENRV